MQKFIVAIKSGMCTNGAHLDAGTVRHLVPPANQWEKALCGTRPGRLSGGWSVVQDEPTCRRCLARHSRMVDRALHLIAVNKIKS